jgi:hypothetical protein
MSRQLTKSCLQVAKLTAAAAGFLIAASFGQAQSAHAASPFAGMSGPWAGGGVIALKGGTRERIRCRARYVVDSGATSLRQELRCASDSYKFTLTSDVQYRNGSISGRWSESTNNLGGTIEGTAKGNHISARIISDIFTAMVALSTSGNHQHVSISSPGSKLEHVSIALRRGR